MDEIVRTLLINSPMVALMFFMLSRVYADLTAERAVSRVEQEKLRAQIAALEIKIERQTMEIQSLSVALAGKK